MGTAEVESRISKSGISAVDEDLFAAFAVFNAVTVELDAGLDVCAEVTTVAGTKASEVAACFVAPKAGAGPLVVPMVLSDDDLMMPFNDPAGLERCGRSCTTSSAAEPA